MAERTKIIWTEEAKEELKEILDYQLEESFAYASDWSEDVEKKLDLLSKFPEMGRIVPEKELSFFREIFAGNYRIIYTFLNQTITIMAVRHMGSSFRKV